MKGAMRGYRALFLVYLVAIRLAAITTLLGEIPDAKWMYGPAARVTLGLCAAALYWSLGLPWANSKMHNERMDREIKGDYIES